jgi:hypothetical protein
MCVGAFRGGTCACASRICVLGTHVRGGHTFNFLVFVQSGFYGAVICWWGLLSLLLFNAKSRDLEKLHFEVVVLFTYIYYTIFTYNKQQVYLFIYWHQKLPSLSLSFGASMLHNT